jgi:hypothetical protein
VELGRKEVGGNRRRKGGRELERDGVSGRERIGGVVEVREMGSS